jgi:hypothetical protein
LLSLFGTRRWLRASVSFVLRGSRPRLNFARQI